MEDKIELKKITAAELYKKLKNEDKILEKKGLIKFDFSDISIIVKQRDVVGNIIQEWVEGYLTKNNISFDKNPNTQMPPDFFLDNENHKRNLLEVKAFNYDASPGFDIADFKAYQKEIISNPHMLYSDYLIFGYKMNLTTGEITIKDMWLKKVWEITSPMANWPVKLQIKNGVVHKIRPAKWYSENTKFKLFTSDLDFISAIEETVFKCSDTHSQFSDWRNRFIKAYNKEYPEKAIGESSLPKWSEIKDKYIEQ